MKAGALNAIRPTPSMRIPCRSVQPQREWRYQGVWWTQSVCRRSSSSFPGTGPLFHRAQIQNGVSSGAWAPGQRRRSLLSSMLSQWCHLVRIPTTQCTTACPSQLADSGHNFRSPFAWHSLLQQDRCMCILRAFLLNMRIALSPCRLSRVERGDGWLGGEDAGDCQYRGRGGRLRPWLGQRCLHITYAAGATSSGANRCTLGLSE